MSHIFHLFFVERIPESAMNLLFTTEEMKPRAFISFRSFLQTHDIVALATHHRDDNDTNFKSLFTRRKERNAHFLVFVYFCVFFFLFSTTRPPSHFVYLLTYRERRVSEWNFFHVFCLSSAVSDESEVQFNDVDGNWNLKNGKKKKIRGCFLGSNWRINLLWLGNLSSFIAFEWMASFFLSCVVCCHLSLLKKVWGRKKKVSWNLICGVAVVGLHKAWWNGERKVTPFFSVTFEWNWDIVDESLSKIWQNRFFDKNSRKLMKF
jgi:hypothetical protein